MDTGTRTQMKRESLPNRSRVTPRLGTITKPRSSWIESPNRESIESHLRRVAEEIDPPRLGTASTFPLRHFFLLCHSFTPCYWYADGFLTVDVSPSATSKTKFRGVKSLGKRVATQLDLARAAGVSLTTVYNALHRRWLVADETYEKIATLIREHDYTPDGVARSMVRQKTDVLGIIVPVLEVAYYAKLVSAIERSANAAGYHCLVCQHLDDPMKEEQQVSMMRQRRVDGLLIRNCGRSMDAGLFQRLAASNMPLVLLGGRQEGLDHLFVGADDRRDACAAVEWLIGKGHRRMAHIAWYRNLGEYQQGPRYRGYCDALTRHGIEFDPALVEVAQTEYQSGRLEILNILRRTAADPPTAVFAVNDHTAMGVIAGLREAGLSVPSQMAVVGFGGYLDQALLPMTLATVAEPIEEIGRCAYQMLMAQIERKSWAQGPILIPGQFRPGQSAEGN